MLERLGREPDARGAAGDAVDAARALESSAVAQIGTADEQPFHCASASTIQWWSVIYVVQSHSLFVKVIEVTHPPLKIRSNISFSASF